MIREKITGEAGSSGGIDSNGDVLAVSDQHSAVSSFLKLSAES
jgi:hypothetical protein